MLCYNSLNLKRCKGLLLFGFLETTVLTNIKNLVWWYFPGSSVVITLGLRCRGHRFDTWSEHKGPHAVPLQAPTPPEKK